MTTVRLPNEPTTSTAPARRTHAPVLLRLLYVYTILGAGLVGCWMLLAPTSFAAAFAMHTQDPLVFGIVACVYVAFGLVSAIGIRSPSTFAPIFLVQLGYKSLWLAFVFLPRLVRGTVPVLGWILAAVFLSYVILDLVALPFSQWFGKAR